MADGKMVTGADCELQNENGQYQLKPQVTHLFDEQAAILKCPVATLIIRKLELSSFLRRMQACMANIILGGGIGALIDHGNGKAPTPTGCN